jgi:glycosyltransferase involved in cell wall biosynthesis
MKISLLVSDFSRNCLGRAYTLGKLLEDEFDVEVVGPLLGDRIWPPADTDEFPFKTVRFSTHLPDFLKNAWGMAKLVSGDIIYASKPLATSLGVGILAKLRRKRPLILDIDDWELGWSLPYRMRKMASLCMRSGLETNGFLSTYLMERLVFLANGKTTASRFLQKRFGGMYIPHARDTEFLDPDRYGRGKLRDKYSCRDEKIIMFLGSPKPHKGLRTLFESLRLLKRPDVKLVIIGATNDHPLHEEVPREIARSVVVKGMVSFPQVPEHLSSADLVVLPQENIPSNYAQVPAKLFDAMAMAKPIIATRISDMPEILRDCGFLAETGCPESLAEKIDYVLSNPDEAMEMGRKARERCIQEYSLNVVSQRLIRYLREILT